MLPAGLAIAAAIALFSLDHGPRPLPTPEKAQELIVLVRPGPAFYFPGPDGELTGFDVDLARRFAAEKKLPLRFALADSAAQVTAAIARGEAHIGAGGLYRPPASAATAAAMAAAKTAERAAGEATPDVLWTAGVVSAQPVLIYNRDGYQPANWGDLDGETVAFVADAGFESDIAAFNIGLGHLEDARMLAQRQGLDPDLWSDVKKVLPLLAVPEHYQRAKLGYARGGMPAAFVDRVRGYYDVLLAHAPSHRPGLGMFATTAAQDAPGSAVRKQ